MAVATQDPAYRGRTHLGRMNMIFVIILLHSLLEQTVKLHPLWTQTGRSNLNNASRSMTYVVLALHSCLLRPGLER